MSWEEIREKGRKEWTDSCKKLRKHLTAMLPTGWEVSKEKRYDDGFEITRDDTDWKRDRYSRTYVALIPSYGSGSGYRFGARTGKPDKVQVSVSYDVRMPGSSTSRGYSIDKKTMTLKSPDKFLAFLERIVTAVYESARAREEGEKLRETQAAARAEARALLEDEGCKPIHQDYGSNTDYSLAIHGLPAVIRIRDDGTTELTVRTDAEEMAQLLQRIEEDDR
jgi:hypothetical protein